MSRLLSFQQTFVTVARKKAHFFARLLQYSLIIEIAKDFAAKYWSNQVFSMQSLWLVTLLQA